MLVISSFLGSSFLGSSIVLVIVNLVIDSIELKERFVFIFHFLVIPFDWVLPKVSVEGLIGSDLSSSFLALSPESSLSGSF